MDTDVEGHCAIENDAKMEDIDTYYTDVHYDPLAPRPATAGANERAAEDMQQ